MSVLSQKPEYDLNYLKLASNVYVHQKDYIKFENIVNNHLQLHNNLRVLSPQDMIFPSAGEGVVHFNISNLERKILLEANFVSCMDIHKNLLIVGKENGEFKLVDLESATLLKTFKVGNNETLINCIKFLDDRSGALKAIIGANLDNLAVYDLETMQPDNSIKAPYFINDVALAPSGQLAVCYDSEEIDLIDFRAKSRTGTLFGHQDHCFSLDFHDNGHHLASGSQDLSCRIWDTRKLQSFRLLPAEFSGAYLVKYLQDSKYLFLGESRDYVSVFPTAYDYQISDGLDFFGDVVGLDTSPCQKELFIGVGRKFLDVTGGILRAKLGPS